MGQVISLFRDTAGAWHWPSIIVFLGWLGAGLTLFITLWFSKRERVESAHKDHLLVEARAKIGALEEATRPQTTAERLLVLFDRVDPKFRAAVESGRYTFTAGLRSFDYGTLQSIAKDDPRIILAPSNNTRVDNEGSVITVGIQISPEVFSE